MRSRTCAIVGSGNIGTDLMYKVLRSDVLDLRALVGIDPASEGLARARDQGVDTSADGIDWVLQRSDEIGLVFDATSARVHLHHAPLLAEHDIRAVDLTPAAVGPAVVPTVNGDRAPGLPNVSLVTCGGQATVPIVAAVSEVTDVAYAEIVSTVASKAAGPGTRQNIDEFTRATGRALETIGGADQGKAIIVLNPAEPPLVMRNTVYCGWSGDVEAEAIVDAIERMVGRVSKYVPGYRLKARPIVESGSFPTPGGNCDQRVVALLEVTGSGDFLEPYAGNLDIMTAAACRVGELIARDAQQQEVAS
jgi:acetaldehyde dehydrogenase